MTASVRPGMGALPYAGGTTFRVWAPFAKSVCVAGTFNSWHMTANPLTHEGNGYWSADIPEARVGGQYKFVLTSPFRNDPLWKNDPYARALTNSVGNSIIAETITCGLRPDIRRPHGTSSSFTSCMSAASASIQAAATDGETLTPSSVASITWLINAIQLLPADEFPTDISWGYNPANIFAIEESYGGPNGLRRLVDAAHARGIAVIFDVVYNHLGPDDLDLWQFDSWNQNGLGGIYFYNDWRMVTPWGWTRPDYGRGEVRWFLRDNVLRWLEQRQCDGLRFDATGWIRNVWGCNNDSGSDIPEGWSLLQWMNNEVRARQPWKITIAEDMQDNEWITKPVDAHGAGFGAQWGAGFLHRVRDAIMRGDDSGRDMEAVRWAIDQRFNGDAFQRVIYTESHDEVAERTGNARVPELIWRGNADSYYSQKRSTLGAALVFTAPGIPMIFMGHERRSQGPSRQCPSRQSRRQGDCLSSLGPRWRARRCRRDRKFRRPRLSGLSDRPSTWRPVAHPLQQRLDRIQRSVQGRRELRFVVHSRPTRRHVLPGGFRHWSLHVPHSLAGLSLSH
jgi:1,4-alpha-glucan branching enzyme